MSYLPIPRLPISQEVISGELGKELYKSFKDAPIAKEVEKTIDGLLASGRLNFFKLQVMGLLGMHGIHTNHDVENFLGRFTAKNAVHQEIGVGICSLQMAHDKSSENSWSKSWIIDFTNWTEEQEKQTQTLEKLFGFLKERYLDMRTINIIILECEGFLGEQGVYFDVSFSEKNDPMDHLTKDDAWSNLDQNALILLSGFANWLKKIYQKMLDGKLEHPTYAEKLAYDFFMYSSNAANYARDKLKKNNPAE